MHYFPFVCGFGRSLRVTLMSLSAFMVLSLPVAHGQTATSLVDEQGMPRLFTEPSQWRFMQSDGPAQSAYFVESVQRNLGPRTISPPLPEPEDKFGSSLARSGETLVIGAWGTMQGAGAAYVSTPTPSGWSEPVQLEAPVESGDFFGWSVASDGTSIVVGARGASEPDSVGEDSYETGAITFFGPSPEGWAPTQRVYSTQRSSGSAFAFSLAMHAGVTLVGEPGADKIQGVPSETGAAYILTRDGASEWSHQQRLVAPDAAAGDVFGLSVALSQVGSRVFAFVASLGSDARGFASGAVYVFERSRPGAQFIYRQKLLALDGQAEDQFGFALSARAGRLVVGAPGVDVPNAPDAGAVYVFELGPNGWDQRTKVIPGAGQPQDRFGYRVSLGQDSFAVSRIRDPGIASAGRRVSVYDRVSSDEYKIRGALNLADVDDTESFGVALNYEQGQILVGTEVARTNGEISGVVQVFDVAALPAPLLGLWGLGGIGLGCLAIRRRRR